ncbi:hypothetical protein WKI71_18295 [Streptomyces sp. MS1.AVA.1]|uniref:Uncharacterized protein n=1 Tax=Streptomyces machairae TaxID=3134109 RepID=A0ABU8UL97_9ACTN
MSGVAVPSAAARFLVSGAMTRWFGRCRGPRRAGARRERTAAVVSVVCVMAVP